METHERKDCSSSKRISRLAFEHERDCLTCMEPLERCLKNDRRYPTLVVREAKID